MGANRELAKNQKEQQKYKRIDRKEYINDII